MSFANTVEPSTSVSQELNVNNIVAIKNGPDGELYFVALMTDGEISGSNRGEGAIFKLAAANSGSPRPLGSLAGGRYR